MKIYPREEIYGRFEAPSDRERTHNAIILGSIAKGKTYIVRPLICSDTMQTISCVKKLGAKVKIKNDLIEIRGVKGYKRNSYRMDCGNSSATMRMMCGVVAGAGISAVLTAGKHLSAKNMKDVKIPLEKMGATVALTDYTVPPVWVDGAPLHSVEVETDSTNAQIKSAILYAGVCGKANISITETEKTDNYAETLLKEMGANIVIDDDKITLNGGEIKGITTYIGGDTDSAYVLLALGILLGCVTVKNVVLHPSRIYLIEILRRMGADIRITDKKLLCGDLIGDITAYKSKLRATHVTEAEAKKIADNIPILAVLMGLAEGESMIVVGNGDGEIRREEYVMNMLNSIGGKCNSFGDGIRIVGVDKYSGGNIKTYGDHRIALSSVVALMASNLGGEIDDTDCIAISFPKFFETLNGSTVGVIGSTKAADMTCRIHKYILEKLNLPVYGTMRIRSAEGPTRKFYTEFREYRGYSVFSPYRNDAYRYAVKYAGGAKVLKTTNALVGGRAYSFEGAAAISALRFIGEDVAFKKVLVIGIGPVARSVIYHFSNAKANVYVYNPDQRPVYDIAKKMKYNVGVVGGLSGEYEIIVNAMSLKDISENNIDLGKVNMQGVKALLDVSSLSERTNLIETALSCGVKVIDGSSIAFFSAYLTDSACFGKNNSENDAFYMYNDYLRESEL